MAAKKPAKKQASQRENISDSDRILDAALKEAASVGWSNMTLAGVAKRANVALGQLLVEIPTRAHIALRLIERVDARTVAGLSEIDDSDSPRDRLFDVLMRRFDVLNKDREGMRAVITGVARDPCAAALVACRLQRSAAMMLGASGINADGPLGFFRVQGLGLIAANGLRAWLNDDSDDLAKTMAAVDRALANAERLMGIFARRPRAETAS